MYMLRLSGHTLNDRIRNKDIRKGHEIAVIEIKYKLDRKFTS